jgi:hypothetical protein
MPRFKMSDGKRIQFTDQEELDRNAEEAQAVIDQQARKEVETARQAKITSGKAKLKELGLDDDELKQILGI